MDYKKIIKSRKLRSSILRWLRFIPDKYMLKIQYNIKLGRKLDLNSPKRYTEKLQKYKLCYKNDELIRCVDKYDVRNYIKEQGLEDILNVCYGVYDSPDEINFGQLPDKFVIKDTLGGGGLSTVIVRDKSQMDTKSICDQTLKWVVIPTVRGGGREWPYYSGKKHRIIIEKYIESDKENEDIVDYKFICFNGNPACVVVDVDRYSCHKRDFFDMNWNNLNILSDCPSCDQELEKPVNFDAMKNIAHLLSKPFPHVRVDLYNIGGKIYFGELTFYPWSGYVQFLPDEFDFYLGQWFELK